MAEQGIRRDRAAASGQFPLINSIGARSAGIGRSRSAGCNRHQQGASEFVQGVGTPRSTKPAADNHQRDQRMFQLAGPRRGQIRAVLRRNTSSSPWRASVRCWIALRGRRPRGTAVRSFWPSRRRSACFKSEYSDCGPRFHRCGRWTSTGNLWPAATSFIAREVAEVTAAMRAHRDPSDFDLPPKPPRRPRPSSLAMAARST
jgi:hypothetical protein